MRLIQVAKIGGLVLGGTTIYGGYKIYDGKNPTGSRLLSRDNFTFKPPKFTNYKNLDHGCSESLFKDDNNFDPNKLYGCGVANMDTYETNNQFRAQTKPVNYIAFNSEIAIRKGNQGWKINTTVDNYNVWVFQYHHLLTTYKKESDGWKETESIVVVPAAKQGNETIIRPDRESYGEPEGEWVIGNNKLKISLPNGVWYDKADYEIVFLNGFETKNWFRKKHKESRSWSGIWVHNDSSSSDSWIFKDIEMFMDDKKHSQIFCKESTASSNECNQDYEKAETRIFNKSYVDEEETQLSEGTWDYANKLHSEQHKDIKAKDKLAPLITAIQDSRGTWVNSDDICNAGYSRNIKEDQAKQLKMFCSVKNKQ